MAQIAVLEGYKMPRRRRRYGAHHRRRRYGAHRTGGSHRARFKRAAKMCSRHVRSKGGSFQACMKRHLKK